MENQVLIPLFRSFIFTHTQKMIRNEVVAKVLIPLFRSFIFTLRDDVNGIFGDAS